MPHRRLLLSCFLLLGCPAAEPGFSFTGDAPTQDIEVPWLEDAPTVPPALACDPVPPAEPPPLQISSTPGDRWWTCAVPSWDVPECACVGDYLDLGDRYPEVGVPTTVEELEAELRAIDPELDGQNPDPALLRGPTEGLSQEVLSAMGGCWLRGVADGDPLWITVTDEQERPGFVEQELVFEDDVAGPFGAILLLPASSSAPAPALVVLPGHGENAAEWISLYHGERYPQRGIALLVLSPRAMCVDENEDRAARALLAAGSSVLAMRMYESVRALRFLQALPQVDGARVGLMGHSTGSISANAIARTNAGFRALVSDLEGNYYAYINRPLMADVMAPRVYPWSTVINDLDDSDVPSLRVGYAYGVPNEDDPQQPNELPRIFDFLESTLGPGASGP